MATTMTITTEQAREQFDAGVAEIERLHNTPEEEIAANRAKRWPTDEELRHEDDLSDEQRAAEIRRSEVAINHAISQQGDDAPPSQRLGALIGELDHLANIAGLKGEPVMQTGLPRGPLTQEQINAALEQAREHRRGLVANLMGRPGVDSWAEAQRLLRAGDRRAQLVGLVPAAIRRYAGLDVDGQRLRGIDGAYEKMVDRKADGLLDQRAKALRTLHGVDPGTPAHLLSSKQYRAATVLTDSEKQLRALRPLPDGEYREALASSRRGASASAAPGETARATATEAAAPRETDQPRATLSEREQMAANRQNAIAAVRDIQAGTPVDGYRSKATDAMAAKIVAQLNEGRDTLNLSARYADTDYTKAKATHDSAVERNMPLIEAVRKAGVPVDTGKAYVANAEKKAEALTPQPEGEKVSA
jgi:hypothetical protein